MAVVARCCGLEIKGHGRGQPLGHLRGPDVDTRDKGQCSIFKEKSSISTLLIHTFSLTLPLLVIRLSFHMHRRVYVYTSILASVCVCFSQLSLCKCSQRMK